jgi:hypothetical protein
MRATIKTFLPIAAAAFVAAAAPAAAQRVATQRAVAPDVAIAGRVRTVATYRLVATGDRNLPDHITVADSAGGLVAYYRLANDPTSYPMLVVVMGADIVLQGETPAGVLTLELFDANDPRQGAATAGTARGRWHVDGRQGELQGR